MKGSNRILQGFWHLCMQLVTFCQNSHLEYNKAFLGISTVHRGYRLVPNHYRIRSDRTQSKEYGKRGIRTCSKLFVYS